MSGGSYSYLFERVEQASDKIRQSYAKDEAIRMMRLDFSFHLKKVAAALKAIEWVDSGDYGQGDEAESILKCINGERTIYTHVGDTVEVSELRKQVDELKAKLDEANRTINGFGYTCAMYEDNIKRLNENLDRANSRERFLENKIKDSVKFANGSLAVPFDYQVLKEEKEGIEKEYSDATNHYNKLVNDLEARNKELEEEVRWLRLDLARTNGYYRGWMTGYNTRREDERE